ncbi:DUF4145 domain-containing protein [Mucisphaera calidilacus]|uniref:DUF4145 domain-containing protein n=1 Tax=Mucisphaera calidilacus TaxID=2527982 RepID=A0A518BVW7_9BACT|nr:DUF4145 domain-containing protein [Mucisphaera calidilacus]QDU71118.1 hypothetical protein Pan265_09670 [Mucisphaera calidilacus]
MNDDYTDYPFGGHDFTPVSHAFDMALDQYRSDKIDRYASTCKIDYEAAKINIQKIEEWIADLFRSSHTLETPKTGSFKEILTSIMISGDSGVDDMLYARSAILQSLGMQFLETFEEAENEIFTLLNLANDTSYSRKSKRYINRVTRCYLWSLYPECIAMCRSVLDVEMQAEIPSDACEITLRNFKKWREGKRFVDLADRIKAARLTKRLPKKDFDAATRIREIGNNILHGKQLSSIDKDMALNCIKDLFAVLTALEKSRPSTS